jgi:hypothetical protein
MSGEIGSWKLSPFLSIWLASGLDLSICYEHAFLKKVFCYLLISRKPKNVLLSLLLGKSIKSFFVNFLPYKDKMFVLKPYLYAIVTTPISWVRRKAVFSRTWIVYMKMRMLRFSFFKRIFFLSTRWKNSVFTYSGLKGHLSSLSEILKNMIVSVFVTWLYNLIISIC